MAHHRIHGGASGQENMARSIRKHHYHHHHHQQQHHQYHIIITTTTASQSAIDSTFTTERSSPLVNFHTAPSGDPLLTVPDLLYNYDMPFYN